MCDYSLGGLPNRLAVEGEELVVHKFRTGSKGLASPGDLCRPAHTAIPIARKSWWQRVKSYFSDTAMPTGVPAVCVPPGAQLQLKDVPLDLRQRWNLEAVENVFFVQVSPLENTYRDGMRFFNGRQVLLQELREGMRVEVLSLGEALTEGEPNVITVAE